MGLGNEPVNTCGDHSGTQPGYGMTLHQWYVGQALAAVCSDVVCHFDSGRVDDAIKYADEVIRQLEERGK